MNSNRHNVLSLFAWNTANLRADSIAGLTVAVLLIPQAMAYALLAGLPPITGLYAALAALPVYALIGTSKQLQVGPVALDSLLVASGLGVIALAESQDVISMAIILAVMVGLIQIVFGFFRLGFIVNFLANPVLSGFTSAAAIIIGLSQLGHILGVTLPVSQQVHHVLGYLLFELQVTAIHLPTVFIGLASLVLLVLMKRWNPLLPGGLVVMVAGALFVWAFDLPATGMAVVGDIPQGLPTPKIPVFEMDTLLELFYLALTIAFVSFMESIAVAKKFAAQYRYEVNVNRELVGLGAANVSAGLFGGYPVAGSFSRTAVNAEAGAKSRMAAFITTLVIALTLLLFTPLFYYVPKASLAAVVLVAVVRLLDLEQPRRLLRLGRKDFLLLLFAFFSTLLAGVQSGILLSILASLLMILSRITRPPSVEFGRVPGTDIFRNLERSEEARQLDGIVIFRLDSSLYFANVSYLKDRIYQLIYHRQDDVRCFIIDASSINEIDSSADTALFEIAEDFRNSGIELYFTNVKGRVKDFMQTSGFYQALGDDHFFFSKRDAVDAFVKGSN
ncbi:MAG: sulfate permease [Gammaproteobacteria bacterium]|nr:sulfate permease [Gammaproteobacteria bacterium]